MGTLQRLQFDLGALADAFEVFEGDFGDGHGKLVCLVALV
jgi:hypothetical protein